MNAGAFSNDKVLAATAGIVPILVDCSEKGSNAELMDKYKVQGYPTVVYTDPAGESIKEMQGREPGAIERDIAGLVKKYPGRPSMWANSQKGALEGGKKAKKPVAIYFADVQKDLAKVLLQLQKDVGDRKGKFLWVFQAGTADALKPWELEAAPAVVVLDPQADDPSKEPLAKIALKPDDKADVLNKQLDEVLKSYKPSVKK